MKQRTREWINKARTNLLSAKVLFDAGLTDPACFHSQQSAEKYLKALLEEHRQAIPRTHDLLVLIDTIISHISVPDDIRDATAMLSVYAVEVRCPGTDTELVDAKEAISCAELVKDWVLSSFDANGMDVDH